MKTTSFYCENCGMKVSKGLDTCPGCGQEFDSVLCPSCGFKGATMLFNKNCPNCGYAGETDAASELKSDQKNQFSPLVYRVLIVILAVILFGLLRVYLEL